MLQRRQVAVMLQARMGSTRLPGKVLLDFNGKPMIEHIYNQIQKISGYDFEFVLSTSPDHRDDALAAWAIGQHIKVSRWPVDDIAGRMHQSLHLSPKADALLRIWGDCVLICSDIIEIMLQKFFNEPCDYMTNAGEGRNLPVGLDAEIYSPALIETLNAESDLFFREYPLQYVLQKKHLISRYYRHTLSMPILNLTVDYPEDMEACKKISQVLSAANGGIVFNNLRELYQNQPDLFQLFSTAERQGEFKQKLSQWQNQKGTK